MAILDLTADVHKQRRPTSIGVGTMVDKFYARFDYLYMGLAVLATETATDVWFISTYPGTLALTTDGDGIGIDTDINNADHIFFGTNTYDVDTPSLITALIDAGYTIGGVESFDSGFSLGFEV